MSEAWNINGLLTPNPVPSVFYYLRRYFDRETVLIYLAQTWFKIFVPHHLKKNRFLRFFYELMAVPILPLLLVQFSLSWKISSKMLER